MIDGGAGADELWGMGGNDRLTGGTEADVFYFGVGEGHDVIMDFTKGQDELVLLGPEGFGFNSFDTNRNGVLDNADVGVTVAQGNTVLDFSSYGAPSTLTVIGVTNLMASDFL